MNKSATKRPPQRRKAAIPDWITRHAADPKEVRSFCRRHRLIKAGAWVVGMASKYLQSNECRVTIEGDPEGSGEWLVFEFDMAGDVTTVLDAYHKFKSLWLAHLSLRRQLLMRLLYNIVEANASK